MPPTIRPHLLPEDVANLDRPAIWRREVPAFSATSQPSHTRVMEVVALVREALMVRDGLVVDEALAEERARTIANILWADGRLA